MSQMYKSRVFSLFVILSMLLGVVGVPTQIARAATTYTVNLTAVEDTWMNQGTVASNYGGSTTVQVNGANSGSNDNGALLKWDLSSIPAGATVDSASITLYVNDTTIRDSSLYQMRRAWVEGTNNGTAGTGASWTYYGAGTGNWGTAGAASTSSDRYNTDLWGATTASFSTTGARTVALNADGITTLEGWINSPSSNYGLTIQNYSGTSNALIFQSSEGANPPILSVTYTVLESYSLTTSASPAAGGSVSPATGSQVEGSVVTVTATANSGYMFTGWSGDLTGTTNPTTITMNGDKTVTANFSPGYCTTANLRAVEDTYINASATTENNGANVSIHVDGGTGTSRRGALLRWDLSSIPSTAVVSSASISVNVTDTSTADYNMYNMRRAWVEGTEDGGTSGTGANWPTYDGANNWGTAGAASTTTDRYTDDLWNATSSSFSATGGETVTLTAAGVGVVQDWIDGGLPNYGVTIQNYSGSTNTFYFDSREIATEANRPTLNVTYCVIFTGPTILTSGTLTAFSTTPGTPSAAQTYTVSGYLLVDSLLITAPAGFELSTDGSTYTPSLTLPPSGGTVNSTTIYVRLTGASIGTFSGDITHVSSSAAPIDIPVTGTVATAPTTVTFQEGVSSYAGTLDTTLKYNTPTTSYGSQVYYEWDQSESTSSDPEIALLRFNDIFGSGVGQIPPGSTIVSATLRYRTASNGTSQGNSASVYESLISWNEAETYNTFGGDAGVQTDEYNTSLVGTALATAQGTEYTVNVTASLQRWSSGVSNYGWVFLADGTDGVEVHSSEVATSSYHPLLTVNYYPPTGPTIMTMGTLSAFTSQPGVVSAEQTYTVSGVNLTDHIIVTAPANFEISTTSGSGFGPSVTLTQSGGTVPATPVFVRFYRVSQGTSSGDIVHTSTDATARNVAVTGTASNNATVTFQYGVSGYTGTLDTFIRGTEGNTNFSADTNLEWDDAGTTDEIALIRFNNIFVSDGGPIPNGATITSASLTYMTTDLNSGSTAFGDPANVYESLVDWPNATVTFNNFGGEADVQADEYSATPVVQATATALSTQYSIDVTASLQRWSNGTANNYGWIFLPTADDGVNIYSSDFATAANRPRLSVTYATGPVNQAPAQPTLVQPTDDATGVSLAPTLEVTVTDPNSDPMDVTFYGRPAGETVGEDFTLVVLPDTQNMATSYPTIFNSMTQWIADNKITRNIAFTTNVGDIVNTSSSTTEWTRADTAYDILDAADVPYSVGPGNHDLGGLYNTYFGPSRFIGNGYYQGSYASGQNENNYSFFSAGGMDFILINLQYNPTTAMRDWADGLLKAYPNRRGIVEQHNILTPTNGWDSVDGGATYNALKDNPNLFMILAGHNHTPTDGSAYRAELGDDGHTIHVLMTDYQDYPSGGNGYLRLLRFSPADNKIYAQVYSPYLGTYLTNASNFEQFEMAYTMSSSAPFEVIGMVNNVASGANSSITWPGRAANTEYEWYAVANDGLLSTTSATWSFTTGSGNPAAFNKGSPADGLTGVSANPVLNWLPSSGMDYYEYCYDTTDDDSCVNWITTSVRKNMLSGLSPATTYYWQARAVNSTGVTYANGSETSYWSFTTANLPGVFGKAVLANGTSGASINPSLTWGASSDATTYEYCYDTTNDSACSNWTNNGGARYVTLSGLASGTTYYWQVRASNSFGMIYADGGETGHWSFTTTNLPGVFGKAIQASGASGVSLNPALTWGASSGASTYEYCYDTTNDGACSNWINNGGSRYVFLSGLNPATTYYWQVRAKNSTGTTYADGVDTAYWTFTTVNPPGTFGKAIPANGTTGASINPSLIWGGSSGASTYEYCYDTTNDSACSTWISNGGARSVTLSGLIPATTYYWQVRAVNSAGVTYADGGETGHWSFTTIAPPGAFGKAIQANGASGVSLNPTLTWGAGSGASTYEYCYDTTNDGVCSTWVSTGGARYVFLSGLSPVTTYYWQVRAKNGAGTTYADGAETAYWTFTTINPPGAFGKAILANGTTGASINPTLTWGAGSGASTYEYCYDTTDDSACSNWISNGGARSVTLSGLSPATTYYWQVRAVNSVGLTYADGGETAYWTFTTANPPGTFGKGVPANGATGLSASPTLIWGPSSGVSTYEYCYDTTNDGACGNWISNGGARYVFLSGLTPGTTYYWQVRAVSSVGMTYANDAETAYWNFTIAP